MTEEKQKALEAAGWVFGNAADFLELTQEEREIVCFRYGHSFWGDTCATCGKEKV